MLLSNCEKILTDRPGNPGLRGREWAPVPLSPGFPPANVNPEPIASMSLCDGSRGRLHLRHTTRKRVYQWRLTICRHS
jgi:hypothetical protein